jgi:hypothetical protein
VIEAVLLAIGFLELCRRIGFLELCRRRAAVLATRDARRPDNLAFALLVIEANRGRLLGPGLILIEA